MTAPSELYTNSATIGTTEYSLPNASTTLTPITTDAYVTVFVDTGNMAAGDQYKLRIKEKVTSGGSQREIYAATLTGTMTDNWVSPALPMLHGWDVTVQKIAGTDRSFSWSIRGFT